MEKNLVNLAVMSSFNKRLKKLIEKKSSWLCVGLDMDPEKLGTNDISDLKKHTFKVIDATRDFTVAYKPNFAFFERWGAAGYAWLEETVNYIGDDHIKIADAKRADIGNTSEQYAKSIFGHFGFDCATINPYLGSDSILPFTKNKEKGVFVLCKTSNNSSIELQDLLVDGVPLFKHIANLANRININDNIGLVIGATSPKNLKKIREDFTDMPFLIPGVGAQGGSLSKSLIYSNISGVGLINVSRGISFAGDMSEKSIHLAAASYLDQMRKILI